MNKYKIITLKEYEEYWNDINGNQLVKMLEKKDLFNCWFCQQLQTSYKEMLFFLDEDEYEHGRVCDDTCMNMYILLGGAQYRLSVGTGIPRVPKKV